MEIAVLDLGSTTFHLQTVRVEPGERFITTLDTKRTPLLGAQVFVDGYLDRRSWLESLEAVRELVAAARACRVDRFVVVATSAIRSASNGAQLVREIERRHDVSVRVLEPSEEARFAFLGQTTSPLVGERRAAVIDLGGGSVEIAVGEHARCGDSVSLPIGALRMRARSTGAFAQDDARALAKTLRPQIVAALEALSGAAPEVTVFGSGSARAVRKLLWRSSAVPGQTGPLDALELRANLQTYLGSSNEKLIELGVEPPRAGSVLIAATIMAEILDQLGVAHAHVSEKGLRDGVVLETYRRVLSRRRELSRFDSTSPAASMSVRAAR